MRQNLERLVEIYAKVLQCDNCAFQDMETEAVISLGSMTLGSGETVEVKKKSAPVSGGAISKFKKKNKEKKKKNNF